jgi:hypothetical protein
VHYIFEIRALPPAFGSDADTSRFNDRALVSDNSAKRTGELFRLLDRFVPSPPDSRAVDQAQDHATTASYTEASFRGITTGTADPRWIVLTSKWAIRNVGIQALETPGCHDASIS